MISSQDATEKGDALGIRKTIGIAAACLASALVSSAILQLTNPTTRDCVMGDSENPREIRARKVVVQPWVGRHQVYGIFIVPKLYGDESKYQARMGIRGLEGWFVVEEGGEVIHDSEIVIAQGYYPKQIYLPTRLVLWKLIAGDFGIIRDRCNWILEFIERSSLS